MITKKRLGHSMIRDEEFDDTSYEELVQLTVKHFDEIENAKKRRIIILAGKLEKLGTPKDMISQRISRDLQGRVNSSYVRDCLGEDYKASKQVREHITSQSRGSTSADDSKKVLVGITNEGVQETIKEQAVKENDLHLQKNDPSIIESQKNEIKNLEQETDYLAGKLAKKSPDFTDLYEENKQLKEIERARIKNLDLRSADSLPVTNELQQKIESLEKKINVQESLLAKDRFKADLELKGQIIPLIILIDRITGKARVEVDTSKISRTQILKKF